MKVALDRLKELSAFLYLRSSSELLFAAAFQTATFVILARVFSIEEFGTYMVLQASVQLAQEFYALGMGDAFIRRVSRKSSEHSEALGHALILVGLGWVPVTTCVVVFLQLTVQTSVSLGPLLVYVSLELVGNRLAAFSEHVSIAHSAVSSANRARLVPVLFRMVVAIAVLLFVPLINIASWIALQGATTCLSGVLVFLVLILSRYPRPAWKFSFDDLKFGTISMITHLTALVQFSIDRIVVGSSLTFRDVAVYSSATRAVQFGQVPVQGVLRNLYSGYFRAGTRSIVGSYQFARANAVRIIGIGLLSGCALLLGAGMLPVVLGPGYTAAVPILRSLCGLPLLQGVQYLLADALTTSENQFYRVVIGAVAAIMYVAIIAVCAHLLGLYGLVVGLYAFQIMSIGAFLAFLRYLAAKEPLYVDEDGAREQKPADEVAYL